MNNGQKALFAIILAAIFGGGIAVFVKIAIAEIPVISLTFFRFLISTIFMLPIVFSSIKHINKFGYKVFLISLLGTANTVIFSFGVGKTSATVSQILYAFVPILIVTISYLLFKERFHRKQILGIIIGFLGVAITILSPILMKGGNVTESFWGNVIILTAIVCFSFYSVLLKHLHQHYSTVQLTGIFLFTSLVSQSLLAPSDLYVHPNWWHHVTWVGIFAILYLGTFGMVLWYILYQYAIKHGTPTIASLTFYLQPITTFGWAFLLLRERLELPFVVGAFITFLGLWVTTRIEKAK